MRSVELWFLKGDREKKERWGDDDGYSSACTISFSCLVSVDRLQFHVFHGSIYLFSSHTHFDLQLVGKK